jgi:glutamate synthase domain-containing protein 2
MTVFLIFCALAVIILAAHDLLQKKHAILRNFPVIGHLRYLIETIGPELRQYIVASNDEERPFTRDQRRWVYASAKKQNNYFGFGTDEQLEKAPNFLIVKQSTFPLDDPCPGDPRYDRHHEIPCPKILGGWRNRPKAHRPTSIINVSAMSYGSLSSAAIEALNRGASIAGCMHNTGEGGVSAFHRKGGDLMFQMGTAYFGCRNRDGTYDHGKLIDLCNDSAIRAIEIKLSQGAKPGRGGILPASKVTPEIAAIRGIPVGQDCISPSSHSSFHDVDSLIDFVEHVAEGTGLPVGIKSAVGDERFFTELAKRMSQRQAGPDFISIDGGEGGTGAAPLVFSDHVSLPFFHGFPRVYRAFAEENLHRDVVFIGSGRLGFPDRALMALSLGCDMIAVAREAMLAIGCIQAQKCHSGDCPTGVATQNKWLMHGLDPTSKSARFANYITVLRKELLWLARACGVEHPSLVTTQQLEMLNDRFGGQPLQQTFQYADDWGLPAKADVSALIQISQRHR